MVEQLAKVVAIYPSAAHRTLIKMLLFGQIAHAHAMANMPPARKLHDRAGPFSHVGPRRYENPARARFQSSRGGASGILVSVSSESFFYDGSARATPRPAGGSSRNVRHEQPVRREMKATRSSSAVATRREGPRSRRSGRASRRPRWGRVPRPHLIGRLPPNRQFPPLAR
jgi:hypothetical protein